MKINQVEWNKFVNYCTNELEYIQSNLYGDDWEILIDFDKKESSLAAEEFSAEASTDYDYRRHHIRVFKKAFTNCWPSKKKRLLNLLLHEYCHLYFNPLTDALATGSARTEYLNTLNERTTELVARNYYKFLYNENATRKY